MSHFIRTRRRTFLDRDKAAMSSAKENGSTMGDGVARTDTLVAEECLQKKLVMLAVYEAGTARRKRHE